MNTNITYLNQHEKRINSLIENVPHYIQQKYCNKEYNHVNISINNAHRYNYSHIVYYTKYILPHIGIYLLYIRYRPSIVLKDIHR